MTWRALSLSPVRSSSRRVTSFLLLLWKKSELRRLLPLLEVCLVVLLAFPGPLRRVTARLVLALRACSCGLLLRQIGLAWALVVLCPLLLRVERTLTILVPSTLDLDCFSSGLSWPSRGTSVTWGSGQVSHMLDAILSCIARSG